MLPDRTNLSPKPLTISLRPVTGLSLALLLVLALLILQLSALASSAFIVNSSADTSDTTPGDGVCADSSSVCTLRAAIEEANALSGSDTIRFQLPAPPITPASPLPAITEALIIDATSQNTARCANSMSAAALGVTLDGTDAGELADGLLLAEGSTGSQISGLIIQNFAGNGIHIQTAANLITCTQLTNNALNGIHINMAADNTIGGNSPTDRNLISANGASGIFIGPAAVEEEKTAEPLEEEPDFGVPAQNNAIVGNYIGTNAYGVAVLGNGTNGVTLSAEATSFNQIGGSQPGQANLISGNLNNGIALLEGATENEITGNKIGTNILGNWPLPNTLNGILIENAADILISDNLISGNGTAGVQITDPPSSIASTGNIITSNIIGADPTGTIAVGNGGPGVGIQNAESNRVGGPDPADHNLISGNLGDGVYVTNSPNFSSANNVIMGNTIGVDSSGTAPLGNGGIGVNLFQTTLTLVQGNLIGANAAGVSIHGPNAADNRVLGNIIGSDASGTIPFGNGEHGVFINSKAHNNQIGSIESGDGNVIALHSGRGIWMTSAGAIGNSIRGNSIYLNQGTETENKLGLDLCGSGVNPNDFGDIDVGANTKQNYPDLLGAYQFDGTVLLNGNFNSSPDTTFEIDIYANNECDASGHGEGEQYLTTTSISTNEFGDASLILELLDYPAEMAYVTATATDPNGNTSEFSNCAALEEALVVTSPADTQANNCTAANCTLREAILAANAREGADKIVFALPGNGSQTISPTASLPELTGPVTVDGLTQPGASCLIELVAPPLATITPLADTDPIPVPPNELTVVLDGSNAGASAEGLTLSGGDSTITGLTIVGFGSNGLLLDGGTNYTVTCNNIGVDPLATSANGNGGHGIWVKNADQVQLGDPMPQPEPEPTSDLFNAVPADDGVEDDGQCNATEAAPELLGDAPASVDPAYGNVVGGNAMSGIVVENSTAVTLFGNVVGMDFTGMVPLGNGEHGIWVNGSDGTQIGMVDEMNVVSGNGITGVVVDSAETVTISGNHIGTNTAGTGNLGNGENGITLLGSSAATIDHNLIAGNGGHGIDADATSDSASIDQNVIGSDVWHVGPLSNGGDGVRLLGMDSAVTHNIIHYNLGKGVVIGGSASDLAIQNQIATNSLYGNVGLGIDLGNDGVTPNGSGGNGPNNLQPYPVLTDLVLSETSTTISGLLTGTAAASYTVQLFANPMCDASGYGEGALLLASEAVTTAENGTATFEVTVDQVLATTDFVTATATDANGNTSEFSACLPEAGPFAAVMMAPAMPIASGEPSETVSYSFTLTNIGSVADSYTLSATSEWDLALSALKTAELEPGASFTFTAEVTIPADALEGASDTAEIRATSTYDTTVAAIVNPTSVASLIPGLGMHSHGNQFVGIPGHMVEVEITITNLGNGADAFAISAESAWETMLPTLTTPLLPSNGSLTMTIFVKIPAEAVLGTQETVTVNVHSIADPSVTETMTITVEVNLLRIMIPAVMGSIN